VQEFWDKYHGLSALDKRIASNQMGDEFKNWVYADKRDTSKLTLEQAATWVKQMRGYIPQQEVVSPKNLPPLEHASADQSQRYDTFVSGRDSAFNMDALQPKLDEYSRLDATQKKQYRVLHPDVDAFYKYYASFMNANPDISKLISPEYQARAFKLDQFAYQNSLRQQSANAIQYMAQRIGGRGGRGGGGGGTTRTMGGRTPTPTFSPNLISARVLGHLRQKWADPSYFIPADVSGQLFSLYRQYRLAMGAQSYAQWIAMLQGYYPNAVPAFTRQDQSRLNYLKRGLLG
jgi:hypothetical protein